MWERPIPPFKRIPGARGGGDTCAGCSRLAAPVCSKASTPHAQPRPIMARKTHTLASSPNQGVP